MPVTKHWMTRHLPYNNKPPLCRRDLTEFQCDNVKVFYYAAGNPTSRGWHEAVVYILAVWYIAVWYTSRWSQGNYRLHMQLRKQAIQVFFYSDAAGPLKKSITFVGRLPGPVRSSRFLYLRLLISTRAIPFRYTTGYLQRCLQLIPFYHYSLEYRSVFGRYFNPLATNVIYIYMEHPFLMFLDHTQRRSTVGRTPLDE